MSMILKSQRKRNWRKVEMDRDDELEKTKAELRELHDAIAKHRALRYGEPAIGPFYSVDQKLYEAAGLLAN
jgi:hypothetical protein